MGQLVIIRLKAKDDKSIIAVNKLAKKAGIKNSFNIEKDNIAWHEDINNNPQSPQKHLKPITLEQLKSMFTIWCEAGAMYFDVAFSRTSQSEAKKYAKFIVKHVDLIESIENGDELIGRYDLAEEEKKVINTLVLVKPEPKKLPKEEQTNDDLQGGIWLCKSWGTEPFWLIYGKVDSPRFLKRRIYEDDTYNNLYRDKQGCAYLMIPLMPFGGNQLEFANKVYDEAVEMGLRESNAFIIPIVYSMNLVNLNDVADHFRKFYTVEELRERFMSLMKATSDTFIYNGPQGFMWSDVKKMFVPCGWSNGPTEQISGRCSVLTSLLRALGPKISAEIMSTMMNKKYSEFEFAKR
jgi:hypothetical protein